MYSSGGIVLSPAFIDASIFLPPLGTQANDICDAIYQILKGNPNFLKNGYPSTGAVVDARGVSGTANLTCTHGSPWTEGNSSVSVPSTILLPAGAIVVSTGWVLPTNTHLIGEGDAISSGTVIRAASNLGNMISFYSSFVPPQNSPASAYTGIAVEKLVLDGNSKPVNGIVNNWAVGLSYVDHVSLYRILGTGLGIGGVASGSGPYTNINFDTGGSAATSSTVCAQIVATAGGPGSRPFCGR